MSTIDKKFGEIKSSKYKNKFVHIRHAIVKTGPNAGDVLVSIELYQETERLNRITCIIKASMVHDYLRRVVIANDNDTGFSISQENIIYEN